MWGGPFPPFQSHVWGSTNCKHFILNAMGYQVHLVGSVFSTLSFKLRKNIPVLVSTTHRKPEYLGAYYCLRSNNIRHCP